MSLNEILSDEDLLIVNNAQALRQRIITELTADDKIPTEKSDRDFLLETLKDTDKSVFTKARLKIANKSADNDRTANAMIAELLAKHTVGHSNFRTDTPELPIDIRPDFVANGEKEIGTNTMSYGQFVK